MHKRIVLAGSLAIACAIAMPARAENFLDQLAGNWTGRGFIKTTEKSEREAIRCRLRTAVEGSGRLSINGSCSVASLMLPIAGHIAPEGGSRYSSNVFQNIARVSSSQFAGRLSGSRLTMQFNGRDTTTAQDIRASLVIAAGRNGFDISMRRTDPQSNRLFDVGTIRFKAGFK